MSSNFVNLLTLLMSELLNESAHQVLDTQIMGYLFVVCQRQQLSNFKECNSFGPPLTPETFPPYPPVIPLDVWHHPLKISSAKGRPQSSINSEFRRGMMKDACDKYMKTTQICIQLS